MSQKIKNALYLLQISAFVLELFKIEKCVKYANERTDDVIHSTQYSLKKSSSRDRICTAEIIETNGSLIVLQATHMALNTMYPWQLTLFQSPLT